MIRVTVKGILGRKLRTALTGFAVVLGVALVSGAYILTDTWLGATDKLSSAAYTNVDAVVTSHTAFDVSADLGSSEPKPVGSELLARVRAVPGVEVAAGEIHDETMLLGSDGKPLGGQGSEPTFAAGIDTHTPGAARMSPFQLSSGRFPRAAREVTIDAASAKEHELGVGDTVGVSADRPVRRFRIVGTATFGSVESIGGATAAIFELHQAQSTFGKAGRLDSIVVVGQDGVAPETLRAAIAGALPPSAQVESAQEQDRFGLGELRDGLGIFQKALLAFGGIALFVGGFVIFNTLSITVAQRAREFAMLRTVGASRRQVLGSVVLEAFAVGLVASWIGIAVGLGLTGGLIALFRSLGIDLPATETVVAGRTIAVSLLLGVGVTTVAGLAPALRATRVEPVTALREGSMPSERRARFGPHVAALTTLLGIAALSYGMLAGGVGVRERLLSIGLGCLVLFVGVALLSSRLVRPLASVLGRPAERVAGPAGRLARENSMRHPGRTAATAAALMIGIALVTFVAIFGQGLRSSYESSLTDQLETDYVVTSKDGLGPAPEGASRALRSAAGVTAVTAVREDQVRAFGKIMLIDGVDPATIGRVYRFNWHAGSNAGLERLGDAGAIVTKRFAEKHGIGLGERFRAVAPTGARLDLTVGGIDARPAFNPLSLGDVAISRALFDRTFETREERYVFAETSTGARPAVTRELARAVAAFPDAKVWTTAQFREKQLKDLDSFLGLLYVLLAFSVIVSLFGIVNTLALSVFERTRELGTLRVVGMTRRQVRRMVRHESIIVALIGAVLGMVVGLFLAALVTQALSDEGLGFSIPVGTLVGFLFVAVLAGMLAAILPARRASRLDVLKALQYE